MKTKNDKPILEKIAVFLATGFYSGYSPIAPGTTGTAVAIPLVYLAGLFYYPWIYIVSCLLVFFIGVPLSNIGERYFNKPDPGHVNIDEIAGYFITMLYVPFTWKTALLGFFVFRFFDIVKPPPARQLEKLHSGWGIMLDDIAAGIFSLIVMHIGLHFFSNYLL